MTAPVPVVLDTDPGIDDALALLLAARWERCRLIAVTTSYGNTTLDFATRNARLVLARAGAAPLVLQGWDRPLERDLITAKETHGAEGLGDLTVGEPEPVHPSGTALRDALRAAREPVILVTLGPLTNLALALRLDAGLVRERVRRHVMMGGNLEAAGNTGPHSEFNVWCDPEAAELVFAAELGTEMVGLDVTRQLVIPAAAVHALATHDDADARWFGRLLGFYVRFHQAVEGLAGAVINDPLAVALAVAPELGAADLVPIAVDRSDGPLRGRTTTAVPGPGVPSVRAWRRFDSAAVHTLLLDHLFGRWLSPADFAA
jgi:inosine-uridine nucleoside N-ribohydrolase